MLVYGGCGLGPAIARRAIKIEGGNTMLAVGTFERNAPVERFGGVISHGLYCK
jgi:hypothetical protein